MRWVVGGVGEQGDGDEYQGIGVEGLEGFCIGWRAVRSGVLMPDLVLVIDLILPAGSLRVL